MKDKMDKLGFGGLILLGAGAGARWGAPVGLMIIGALLLLAYAYVEVILPSRGRRRE